MCGIAGLLVPEANPELLEQRARAAAARLAHRGPDEDGFHFEDSLALAHRRLIVIDKEGGAQPFHDSRGRVIAVYNGEIYNHHELREQLEAAGEHFETRSDTEVFVKAFAHWGSDAFAKFDGMFAAALWSVKERRLTLVRDASGEKPLFYFERPTAREGVAFSSEVFSLLALLDEVPPVDPVGLWSYLTLGYARAPRILQGVEQIEPAGYAVFENGKLTEKSNYWRAAPAPTKIKEADALPLIRERIHHATASRLESDVPLGAFLSGGVDSTILVHEMRRAGVEDLSTFSIGFSDGVGYDESPWARRAAEAFNTKHFGKIVTGDEALMDAVLDALDEPMADSSAIAVHALAAHAREHITVALGGDGGDEVFCGYERFAGIAITERVPAFALAALKPFAGLVPDTGGYGNRGGRLRRLLSYATRPPMERLLRWQSLAPAEQTLDLLSEKHRAACTDFPWPIFGTTTSTSPVHEALRVNFESYLPDDLLVKADRMTMAHSLELRAPFLSREVIELGHALPARGLTRGLSLKRWMRKAYAGIIEDEILNRRKHGFGVPFHEWIRGPLRDWAAARLLNEENPLYAHLDFAAVRALWDAHQSRNLDAGQRIYGLLVLSRWLERIHGA